MSTWTRAISIATSICDRHSDPDRSLTGLRASIGEPSDSSGPRSLKDDGRGWRLSVAYASGMLDDDSPSIEVMQTCQRQTSSWRTELRSRSRELLTRWRRYWSAFRVVASN